jgi:hypothetical protein
MTRFTVYVNERAHQEQRLRAFVGKIQRSLESFFLWYLNRWFEVFPRPPSPSSPTTPVSKRACLREGAKLREETQAVSRIRAA